MPLELQPRERVKHTSAFVLVNLLDGVETDDDKRANRLIRKVAEMGGKGKTTRKDPAERGKKKRRRVMEQCLRLNFCLLLCHGWFHATHAAQLCLR